MKKLVVRKGTQSEVSARSVPSWVPPQFLAGQDFLSNSTQCTQKKRKTFWKGKVEERRLINHPANQSKRIGKTWVPSVPRLTTPGKIRLCGSTHISTQHKEPSAVRRTWVPKTTFDGISPRSINLAQSNRRSPMLTQDRRWIWWASLPNAATNRRNGNPPQFTGISQNLLFLWPVKQLNEFEGRVLIEKLSFGYMCMWTRVKDKSNPHAPTFPVSAKDHNSRQNKALWKHSHQHSAQGVKCHSSQLNAKKRPLMELVQDQSI